MRFAALVTELSHPCPPLVGVLHSTRFLQMTDSDVPRRPENSPVISIP